MKIVKWILGILAGLSGIVALFAGNKNKKETKKIRNEIKDISTKISTKKEENKIIDKKIKSSKEKIKKCK